MGKLDKKDKLNIFCICLIYLSVALIITRGEFVFGSIKDAEKFLNISYRSHIAKVCNGKRQTFKGYKWKWI